MRAISLLGMSVGLALGAGSAVAQAPTPDISYYHNDPIRSGLYVTPNLTWARAATARLEPTFAGRIPNEHTYAQPLYWVPPGAAHGLIIVATMSDTVRAFDAGSGAQVWMRTVGTPVPSSALPCGGQNPWGIAGTPVINAALGQIYFDAEVLIQGVPKHQIFGLSLVDGSVLPGWPIDVESALAAKGITFSTPVQDQRGGLALVNHKLYVAYGGHGGDCGNYHGWVVGFDTLRPGVIGAWSTRALKGGSWGPGGVTYDGTSLFITTGNSYPKRLKVWGDGMAVIRVPPDLTHSTSTADYFTPLNWRTLDETDLDLSGTGPLPLNVHTTSGVNQYVLALGKDGNAYLTDRANLGGIGGALVVQSVANSEIKTGPATYPGADGAFVAFNGQGSQCPLPVQPNVALTVLKVTADPGPQVSTAWCASLASTGSPIVTTTDGKSNPIVWIVGSEGDGLLHGYEGDNGKVLFDGGGSANQMVRLRRFGTLIAAEDRLYVVGDSRLYAFSFAPP